MYLTSLSLGPIRKELVPAKKTLPTVRERAKGWGKEYIK